ncbi:MAG TPA: anti-sigma regulatory factor [Rhizomicrobium sp.]|jgi:serine/threonine-protein kinase RsbT
MTDTFPIQSGEDVVRVRQEVRALTVAAGFSLVDQTKFITAASELARNTLLHGGGGQVYVSSFEMTGRKGVRLVFEDQGPGIADIERALQDGYSTGGGLGLGLSGARRLSNEFQIESRPGEGTRITIARWK